MPDYSAEGAATGGRGLHRGKPAPTLLSEKGLRQRLTLLAVAPTASVTVAAAGAYAACAGTDSAAVAWGAGTGAAVVCGSALTLAWRAARATARNLHASQTAREATLAERSARLRAVLAERIEGIQQAAQRIQQGEPAGAPAAAPDGVTDAHPLTALEYELHHGLHATHTAVLQAATRRQLDAFTTIARRLQSLVVRALKSLDEAERIVEDPELLNTLFGIDHLITRIQRSVESIAVLGGAVPREIRHPVPLATVLRQAIAEIEQYPRVRVLPVAGGVQVRGHAAVETIHLVAELAENATRFSPPSSQVLIRSEMAGSGMVIEVEDRGLGMSDEDRRRMNELLAHPEQYDVEQQLKDGRTGLFVAAKIARRRGLTVRLEANMYAGTQAIVILPHAVLHAPSEGTASASTGTGASAPVGASAPRAGSAAVPGAAVASGAAAGSGGGPSAGSGGGPGVGPEFGSVAGSGVGPGVGPGSGPAAVAGSGSGAGREFGSAGVAGSGPVASAAAAVPSQAPFNAEGDAARHASMGPNPAYVPGPRAPEHAQAEASTAPRTSPDGPPRPDGVPVGPVGPVVQAGARPASGVDRVAMTAPGTAAGAGPMRGTAGGADPMIGIGRQAGPESEGWIGQQVGPEPGAGIGQEAGSRSWTGVGQDAGTGSGAGPEAGAGIGQDAGTRAEPDVASQPASLPRRIPGNPATGHIPSAATPTTASSRRRHSAPSPGVLPQPGPGGSRGPVPGAAASGAASGPVPGAAAPANPTDPTPPPTPPATNTTNTTDPTETTDPTSTHRPPLTQRTRRGASHLAPELRHGAPVPDGQLPPQADLDGGLLARYAHGVQAARQEPSRSDDEHQEN
ncbi:MULTISPECIES: ATP-binding protein [unclassified Streptomyces]|uniref:ATP-binding protein n=1 Tax=unclassified Streptomyces TaxID=2593676 RepID=UPI00278C8621|nr:MULTISPECIES: ATP-binding protein [unclassified Streptomyces]